MERLTERYVPNDEKNGISGIKVFESENKMPLQATQIQIGLVLEEY